jgi:hypothetical protein
MQLLKAKEKARSYELQKKNVYYLVADNASLNPLTAEKLRSLYDWIAEFVRCLPHCLNLVMVALLEPFNAAFGISVRLCYAFKFVARQFSLLTFSPACLTRRVFSSRYAESLRLAVEVGARLYLPNMALQCHTLSECTTRGLLFIFYCKQLLCSFADTRWDSFICAVRALSGDQTADELARARDRLIELASQGDDDAKVALDEPDILDTHWNAIYSFLEEVAQKKADKRGEYLNSAFFLWVAYFPLPPLFQLTGTLAQQLMVPWHGCVMVLTLLPSTSWEN